MNEYNNESNELNKRKDKILSYLKVNRKWIIYIILISIVIFSYNIRTNHLGLLNDVTTNDYTPIDLDSYLYLRYAQQVIDYGKVLEHDTQRFYPFGYKTAIESIFVSYFIAYLYKFLHFFNSNITLNYTDVIYPAIVSSIGLIFFFLFVRKLFDYRVALLSSFLLTLIPSFLYRTMSPDKEALASMFMLMALYFFIAAWKSNKLKNAVIFGLLSGVSTGLMALSWGGVQYLFLTIGFFMIAIILLDKLNKKRFFLYSVFMFSTFIVALKGKFVYEGYERFTISNILTSFTTEILLFAFLVALIYYLIYHKNIFHINKLFEKYNLDKHPKGLVSVIIALLISYLATIIIFGFEFVPRILKDIYIDHLMQPFSASRWVLTVAENHPVYVTDWISNMGLRYVILFIVGFIIIFYRLVRSLKKYKWALVSLYSLFILGLIFTKYSQDSIYNGTSPLSLNLFIISFLGFMLTLLIFYFYSYYKNKDLYNDIKKINTILIFILIWAFFAVLLSRSAIRLLSLLAPVSALIVSYLIFYIIDNINFIRRHLRDTPSYVLSLSVYLFVFILVLAPFSISANFALGLFDEGIIPRFIKIVIPTSKSSGPGYNTQWQLAMAWVRENTSKDAIFAHWWDYGYWVQYGGQRTTLSDGGNAISAINHFVGRYVLTAQSEEEALEFLKSRGANYLLIISDEIGKYPAFSSIGADVNYDRYSWISTFILDQNRQETRDKEYFVYRGGTTLDDDFEYQGNVFPGGGAGIGAFLVPIENEQNLELGQPIAIIVYNNQQFNVPLKCFYLNDKLVEYEGDGLDGCLRIIPSFVNNNQANLIGAALYLSPDVKKSLFAQLYLFNKKTDNFEIVYDDSNRMPLSVFNGRVIGPLRIWKINAPDYIKINPIYQGDELPDPRVTLVRR